MDGLLLGEAKYLRWVLHWPRFLCTWIMACTLPGQLETWFLSLNMISDLCYLNNASNRSKKKSLAVECLTWGLFLAHRIVQYGYSWVRTGFAFLIWLFSDTGIFHFVALSTLTPSRSSECNHKMGAGRLERAWLLLILAWLMQLRSLDTHGSTLWFITVRDSRFSAGRGGTGKCRIHCFPASSVLIWLNGLRQNLQR